MHFNVNFNVFFTLIKMHLLVSELYILSTYMFMFQIVSMTDSLIHSFLLLLLLLLHH